MNLTKYIMPAAIVVLICVIAVMAIKWPKPCPDYSAAGKQADSYTVANNQMLDTLQKQLPAVDSIISHYEQALAASKEGTARLQKKYNKLYEEIYHAPDSSQLAITKRLLTAHRARPLKGN